MPKKQKSEGERIRWSLKEIVSKFHSCLKCGDGDPVGAASDQCYKFVIDDDHITDGQRCEMEGGKECLRLVSWNITDGRATFVICCKKDPVGRCMNCTQTVTLRVRGDSKAIAERKVTVGCIEFP